MNQTLLELRSVTCERDDEPLFAPLSFALHSGDIVQLDGANGIGKTSLLRCIGGLSSRFDGELLWRGESLARKRHEFTAATIYIGHAAGLKAALSPRENLLWWASLRGVDARTTIDVALAKVRLAGYEDSPCYQLSAGQQRRVALARLFLTDAVFWVLDEPFTAIDRAGVAELEQWLVAHADSGGAVLLTTHQPLVLPRALRKIALQAEVAAVG
ncbi:MAG: heme transporter ATP-binding protein CcmA [Verrucomicrobiaceae bacterium]|nr:heme transporter ATP-binding protein CcmA [Verrucomicrobiaceae bacterium]